MKQLSRLKLNQLGKAELEKREMNLLVGGECCRCGCNRSSSTEANFNANWYNAYSQSAGGAKTCAQWYVWYLEFQMLKFMSSLASDSRQRRIIAYHFDGKYKGSFSIKYSDGCIAIIDSTMYGK